MSAQHTPGPWSLIGHQGTSIWANNEIIASVNGARAYHPIARKNAELIAAAPELLESLEQLVNQAENHGAVGVWYDEARAAIAKAKGAAQ